jgi:ribosomal protein S18 acetylase RimI-like enzyme
MILAPWSAVPDDEMRLVFEQEAERWRDSLSWDTEATWRLVDASRRSQALGGVVARDPDDRIAGWCFYLLHRDDLQIGGLTADRSEVTSRLLDAALDSPEARMADRVMLFTLAGAPCLGPTLRERGFTTGTYRYMQRAMEGRLVIDAEERRSTTSSLRPWRPGDVGAAAALLASAYSAPDPLRPFAGRGSPEEWAAYVGQLTMTTGCGEFQPALSVVAPGAASAIDGAALVSDLGFRTAHLAQLAVAPPAQRTGLGRHLLASVLHAVRAHGFERLTLLVSDRNDAARRLYATSGFEERAMFAAASIRPSRRSTAGAGTA